MKSFSHFLSEDTNTHLEHLEDDIINNGVAGGQNAIAFLEALRDMFATNSSKAVSLTVKWDGAPAIFAGINPENGKYFVGTKSIFNKVPLINYTHADIDKNHPAGPGPKLHVALDHFKKLKIPGIWQGDMLFTKDDLEASDINGESMLSFKPNTITYAVPMGSKLEKTISKAKIGIVWHTTYSGDTMDSLSANFGADAKKLSKSSSVWSTDAGFSDESGTVTMTASETDKFNRVLNMASGSLKKATPYLGILQKTDPKKEPWALASHLKIFFNSQIREGTGIKDTRKLVTNFEKYYSRVMMKKIDSVKSDKAKENYTKLMKIGLKEYVKYKSALYFVVASYITLATAKKYILRKLEQISGSVSSFLKTSDGFKVTAPEGFVAISHDGKALKLVDRMEFSRANFTVAKDWT
mgnify:CR=1 FL=1